MIEQAIAQLEGRDQIIYQGDWLEIVLRDGWYEFARYTNSNGGVYILPYRDHPEKPILGRYEITPAHLDQKPTLTTITGGVSKERRAVEVAIEEMYEEAGYQVEKGQLINLGTVYLAKGADFVGHLYAVDVTGLSRGEAPGDGSQGEEGAYCDWVTVEQMIKCKDPVASCLILRAWTLGLITPTSLGPVRRTTKNLDHRMVGWVD